MIFLLHGEKNVFCMRLAKLFVFFLFFTFAWSRLLVLAPAQLKKKDSYQFLLHHNTVHHIIFSIIYPRLVKSRQAKKIVKGYETV